MWEMAKSSIVLFAQGKLFADPAKVFRQIALAAFASLVLMVVLVKIGVPLAVAATIAGLAGGALQPYLFKDLRYR